MLYTKQEWMKTREEMNELFADVPEALSYTLELLDKVEYYSIDHAPIMPTFAIPEDFGTEEGYRAKMCIRDSLYTVLPVVYDVLPSKEEYRYGSFHHCFRA